MSIATEILGIIAIVLFVLFWIKTFTKKTWKELIQDTKDIVTSKSQEARDKMQEVKYERRI